MSEEKFEFRITYLRDGKEFIRYMFGIGRHSVPEIGFASPLWGIVKFVEFTGRRLVDGVVR